MTSPPAYSSLPKWAVLQADASLKIGHSVPEIESGLVAKGLSPTLATAVVTAVLEGRVRATQQSLERAQRWRTAHRLASVVAACICLGLEYGFRSGGSVVRMPGWPLLPLACIWWAEVIEKFAPPALIRWVAWLVLILTAGYRVVLLSL